jgi:hypothetical protein
MGGRINDFVAGLAICAGALPLAPPNAEAGACMANAAAAFADVRHWHKADIPRLSSDVRYWG